MCLSWWRLRERGAKTVSVSAVKRYSMCESQGEGKYDGQLWDMDAKKEIFGAWNPEAQRDDNNFNPFERNPDGNAPDCSGYYPGEGKYKDPSRPNVNFASMMAEKEVLAAVATDPKFDVVGKIGNYVAGRQ